MRRPGKGTPSGVPLGASKRVYAPLRRRKSASCARCARFSLLRWNGLARSQALPKSRNHRQASLRHFESGEQLLYDAINLAQRSIQRPGIFSSGFSQDGTASAFAAYFLSHRADHFAGLNLRSEVLSHPDDQ